MALFEAEPLPWDAAEEAFIAKEILTHDQFMSLAEEYRGYAFTVVEIQEHVTLNRIKSKLEQIIEDGGTIEDFQKWAASEAAFEWADNYTELVYRMNVQGAYSKARWDEMNDPAIVDAFPFLIYDTADDDRVRSSHAVMDGFASTREDFPEEWVPKNGFNCRCILRPANEDLARRAGADIQTSVPEDDETGDPARPDKGFRSNQAADYGKVLDDRLSEAKKDLRR